MKSAAENDDQARSPAAERLRRREEICATIIMAAAYKGVAAVRQQNRRMSKWKPRDWCGSLSLQAGRGRRGAATNAIALPFWGPKIA